MADNYATGLNLDVTVRGLTRAEALALLSGALDNLPLLHPAREKPEVVSLFRADPWEQDGAGKRYVVQIEGVAVGRAAAMLADLADHCTTVASGESAA